MNANPGPSWKAIGTGDFNGDGHSDILWQNTNGQAAIWEMNGTSHHRRRGRSANPGPSWKAIGTGDFNGDGHSDILWQNTDGQVAIWEMNGTNIIGGGTRQRQSRAELESDRDRRLQRRRSFRHPVAEHESGQVAIWEMNGTNIIGGGPVGANPGPSWKAIGTGDFNGDGHSDILLQNTRAARPRSGR